MRILIAEDKRAFAGHIGRALANEGHSIELAYDGNEALRLGRTAAFDLMLLDVMLPYMDGFSIIRKLREDRLQTQTILVSARDSMEDIIAGLDAGADDYLTKPFALDVLLAKVRATETTHPAGRATDASIRRHPSATAPVRTAARIADRAADPYRDGVAGDADAQSTHGGSAWRF